MEFLSANHEENFNSLVKKVEGRLSMEHKVLFYILSGNSDLFNQVEQIYDFNKDCLLGNQNENGELYFKELYTSSSSKSLLNLGIQLFNRYLNNQSVADTFLSLDSNNRKLALNSIRIRFDV